VSAWVWVKRVSKVCAPGVCLIIPQEWGWWYNFNPPPPSTYVHTPSDMKETYDKSFGAAACTFATLSLSHTHTQAHTHSHALSHPLILACTLWCKKWTRKKKKLSQLGLEEISQFLSYVRIFKSNKQTKKFLKIITIAKIEEINGLKISIS